MTNVRAEALKIGDTILPPAREVNLWMRRHCQENNLPESALHLTITDIVEGTPDKRGRWLIVRTEQSAAWNAGRPKAIPFNFKARPETSWPLVQA
jgi:hypothetical protein